MHPNSYGFFKLKFNGIRTKNVSKKMKDEILIPYIITYHL